MYRLPFTLLLTIVAALFSFPATISAQQSPDTPDVTGTAFFVSNTGMAVTNYHVVQESGRILLFDPQAGWATEARVVAADPYNDLAVLQADVKSKALPIADRFALSRGDEVLTLGYPSPALQGVQQKATFGRINADTGAGDDVRYVQVDVPIQPGNSGGPLLNGKGQVIGVITSQLRVEGGFQNVGYAIKVDYLRPLLTKASIPALSSSVSSSTSSMSRVVNASQDSVVMVLGYRQSQPGKGGNTPPSSARKQEPPTRKNLTKDNIDYIQKAADHGDAVRQFILGVAYANGCGVTKDNLKAVEWWQKAADQGDVSAQAVLGYMSANGRGMPKDDRKTVEWWQKAADQGAAWAQTVLGNMYGGGCGLSQDEGKAVEWYRKAAEQGFAKAQNNLGLMYANGQGVPKDERKAVEWYRKAADQGLAVAQNTLGVMYEQGRGVPKDVRKAMEWYQKAADQGYAGAQYNLGLMYANGQGVPKDERKAVEWYQKAADQGEVMAQFNLGWMYQQGNGVPKDDRKAVEWFQKAADQGDAKAQGALGSMYYNGQGIIRDRQKGCALVRESAEQGSQPAIDFYNRNCAK